MSDKSDIFKGDIFETDVHPSIEQLNLDTGTKNPEIEAIHPKHDRAWRKNRKCRDTYSSFIFLTRHKMFDMFVNGKPEAALSSVMESARFWRDCFFRDGRERGYHFFRFSAQL